APARDPAARARPGRAVVRRHIAGAPAPGGAAGGRVTLGLVLAFGLALGWIPLYVFRAEVTQDALRYYSAVERRGGGRTPLLVAAHVTLACLLVSRSEPPLWRATIGAGLFVTATAFWFWARLQIGPLRAKRLPIEPPRRFRRDGAFGIVRNPLYF